MSQSVPARRLLVAVLLAVGTATALHAPAAHAASSVTPTVHTVSPDGDFASQAVNAAGQTIVAYTEGEPAASTFVRRLGVDGTLGPAVRVSGAGEATVRPKVVLADDGRAFVVWRSGIGSPYAGRGRWVAADGTLGPVLTLAAAQNFGLTTDRDVSTLDAVLADDGRVTVTFRNEDSSATDYQEMGLRRITAAGGLLPAAGPLTNVSLNSGVTNPVVAALPGGGTVLAWRSVGIEATVVGPAEVAPAAVSTISTTGLSGDPSLDVDASGRTVVAWRRSEAGQYAVTARRLAGDGTPSGGVFSPSALAAPFVRVITPVLLNPAGDALFGWARQPVNDAVLTIRSRSAAGVLGPAETPLSDPAFDVRTYALADDGLGNAYAAWMGEQAAAAGTFVRPLTFTGSTAGPPQILDTNLGTSVEGLALGAGGVGTALLQRSGTTTPVLLRQLIPPPGGCTDTGATTPAGAAVAITVSCAGVQTVPEVVSAPAHGGVGPVGADGRLTYTPIAGFSGTDTFTVRAVNAAGVTGGAATVTVQVVPGAVAPAADVTAPVLSRVSLSSRRFRAGGLGAQAAARRKVRRAPAGTTVRFTLSEAATVRITLQRTVPGRRAGKRCVAPTKRNGKARRCTRTTASGAITRAAEPAGARSVAFSGRRRGKALPAGSYRAIVTASDKAGNRSRPVTLTFTIVRG